MHDPITPSDLNGKIVFVAEDEVVTAADYYFELKRAGAKAVGFSATNRAALAFLANHKVDAAIVDYLLGNDTGEAVVSYLCDRQIPFVVVSGYTFRMAHLFPHTLTKPVNGVDLVRALSHAMHS